MSRCLPILVALLLCCGAAIAAPQPVPSASPSFLRELMAILLPLAFIILGLFLVLRLVRRRYGLTGQDTPLSVVQILPVGPRERVVLLRTRAGRILALGVSPQSVNLVATLDQDDIGSADTAAAQAPERRSWWRSGT